MPDTPQFSTAEYAQQPTTERCRLCGTPLATEYYRVRGQAACASCADAARGGQASDSSSSAFNRALLFGIGAAIVGIIGYSAFTIATNWIIGYMGLAVGYIIARAMRAGSGGVGGRRYQIVAVVLTYLAIALAEVPIGLWDFPNIPIGLWHFHAQIPAGRLLAVSFRLLYIGLISPIWKMSSPAHGLVNLVILYVGLSIAWRGTAAASATVEGPFRLTPAAS